MPTPLPRNPILPFGGKSEPAGHSEGSARGANHSLGQAELKRQLEGPSTPPREKRIDDKETPARVNGGRAERAPLLVNHQEVLTSQGRERKMGQ